MKFDWLSIRLISSVYLLAMIYLESGSAALAQQPKKTPRIGILRVGSPPDLYIDALRAVFMMPGITKDRIFFSSTDG